MPDRLNLRMVTKMQCLDKLCELNDYLFTFQATKLAQNLVAEIILLTKEENNDFTRLRALFCEFLADQETQITRLKVKVDELNGEEKDDTLMLIDYYDDFRSTSVESIDIIDTYLTHYPL